MLDLFCGMKGASQAMRDRGWRVLTVDNDAKFEPDICVDVISLTRHDLPGDVFPIDLLWASPPCDEFSREFMPWSRTGATPSLTLVEATKRLVNELAPRWWVMENTRGAQWWLGPARMHYGAYFLWGEFPLFLCRPQSRKEQLSSTQSAERAKIPFELSLNLALACESTP